jgi:tetratricopeptide (TPR) repeat protein
MPNPIDSGVFSELNNSILSTTDIVSRTATGLYLQFLYLAKLIVPFWLSHDYSYNQIPVIGIVSFKFLLALIVIFGAIAILAVTYKRNKLIFFGVLFYFLTLATVSNIVFYIGATFAERFLFTPSFGFAIVTGSLLLMLLKNIKAKDSFQQIFSNNKVFTAILFLVLIVYSVTTVSRNRDWKDNLSLYATDVNRSPNSARAHYNYGSALMAKVESGETGEKKMGMLHTASVELKKAVAIYPGYTDAYNNLGNVYSDMGNKDSAVYYYAQTLKMDSGYMKGYFNLGINYYSLGRYAEAIPMLGKYAMYKPETPQIYYYIGNSYGGIGKFDEAIICLEKNLTLGGENLETLVLLGKAYGFMKQLDKSLEIFNCALKVDPNNGDLLFNLGLTYNYLGQPEKSIEFFQRSIQVNPGFVPAYYELANAFDKLGKGNEASIIRAQATQIQQKQ